MKNKLVMAAFAALVGATLSGCAPLVLGAAGAVVVDEALERRDGGDGLF